MAEKLKYHLQHENLHIWNIKENFYESKPSKGPYIWYQNLGFSL